MKTTIDELVDTLNQIDTVCKDLYHLSVKTTTTEEECDTCSEASSLLSEFKKMILRTKVEI